MGKLKAIKEAVEAAGRRLDDYATRVVYHGSPHDFDAFDLNKIGTGEGAQAYGHGLYFTEKPEVAMDYRDKLSPRGIGIDSRDVAKRVLDYSGGDYGKALAKIDEEIAGAINNPRISQEQFSQLEKARELIVAKTGVSGRLYRAEIPTTDYMLDWDKPLSEQPEAVQKALAEIDPDLYSPDGADYDPSETGQMVIQRLMNDEASKAREAVRNGQYIESTSKHGEIAASKLLLDKGIVGINYVGDSSGVRNAVVFDDQLVRILEKGNADPRLLAALAAGSAGAIYAGRQLSQPGDFQSDPGLPALDPAYAEFSRRREAKRDTWRQLKEGALTMGSAMAGGIIGDLSRLGGYLNPFMPVERTEQGAQGIENALMYQPTGPNRYLEGLGRGIEQAQEDFAPLTEQIPQSIPGRAYNALPERAQGLIRIGADLAL